jgi:phosphoribosyl-ATP pyrophosphohydrolase
LFSLETLAATIAARAAAEAGASYTRTLLDKGAAHCARKFGEEAVEAIVAACSGSPEQLRAEAGDVLYHLLVLLQARGVTLAEVLDELAARTQQSGHAEKAARREP